MIGLTNPWVLLGAVLTVITTYVVGHHRGYWERDAEVQIEIAQLNEKARTTEQKLTKQLNDQATELRKANHEITKKQSDLNRLAAAGKLRLPAASCVQPAQGASAPSGDRAEAASELERQTIEALISIAADGDRAATQANACIDAYNKVMEQINGER